MADLTVGAAASRSGWSARMLRYLEQHGLVVPRRTPAGYRLYGLGELNQLRALRGSAGGLASSSPRSRSRHVFAASPSCGAALDGWLAAAADLGSWIDWEQRKHERLLAA